MISLIFGFLGSLINPLSKVATDIAKYKIAQTNATTEQEKIHAAEMVATLQARQAVLIAEASGPWGWVNPCMRFLIALGPMVVLNKIFIWDKALGWGSTDRLDDRLWNVIMVVLGFYFVSTIADRVFKK